MFVKKVMSVRAGSNACKKRAKQSIEYHKKTTNKNEQYQALDMIVAGDQHSKAITKQETNEQDKMEDGEQELKLNSNYSTEK